MPSDAAASTTAYPALPTSVNDVHNDLEDLRRQWIMEHHGLGHPSQKRQADDPLLDIDCQMKPKVPKLTCLSRHDPTTPDATPLSPDARRDTTNVRLKLRAVPSVCSFITSQIWNLQRLVSPRQPRLYLVSPPL